MGLITDFLKKAQQLRSKEAEETSTVGTSRLNQQKRGSSKKRWSFIIAGLISLGILSFVLLRNYIPLFTTQPGRALAPGEGKPSSPIAEKKTPESPREVAGLPKEENSLNSGQALNRTESGREDKEKSSQGRSVSGSRPDLRQEEKKLIESNRPFREDKRKPMTQQVPKEESQPRFTRVEPEGGREMDLPVGTVISQGNVKMEVKDKVWRTLESPYAPILKGKKIKIENETVRISLSNNSLIEVNPKSLLSFEHEGQLNLFEGGIHFKIPAAAQMNFKIGALSVMKPHPLTAQKGLAAVPIREEETGGSLLLHQDGSLTVRSVQGSLSILDRENRVLATTSSNRPITIPPEILSGRETWKPEQQAGVPVPEGGQKFEASMGKETGEIGELEKYLIEFSIHLEGKDLPADLDAEKFFALLETVYPHPDIIEKVKQYPVHVRRKGKSYVLNLCDQKSEWKLYEDLGETTRVVDHIYDPEERKVRCREAFPLYWILTGAAAGATAGVVWYEVDKHNDHDHRDTIPLCP